MKRLLWGTLLVLFLTVGLSLVGQAQDNSKNLGVGVMVGEPTGLTLKSWFNERNAFDAGLAWSFGRYDAIHIHADYLWHSYSVFNDIEEGTLPLYYGIGARAVFGEDDSVIGARIPLGLNYLFEEAPIGMFLEVAPVVNLIPETDLDVNGGLGVRVYLN
jgi:hypothetical protein